jgi:hypothetical protein
MDGEVRKVRSGGSRQEGRSDGGDCLEEVKFAEKGAMVVVVAAETESLQRKERWVVVTR